MSERCINKEGVPPDAPPSLLEEVHPQQDLQLQPGRPASPPRAPNILGEPPSPFVTSEEQKFEKEQQQTESHSTRETPSTLPGTNSSSIPDLPQGHSDPAHPQNHSDSSPPLISPPAQAFPSSSAAPRFVLNLSSSPAPIEAQAQAQNPLSPIPSKPISRFIARQKYQDEHGALSSPSSDRSAVSTPNPEPHPQQHHPHRLRPFVLAIMAFEKGRKFSTGTSVHRKRQMSTLVEKEGAFGPALTVSDLLSLS